jgi:hypothetical protein
MKRLALAAAALAALPLSHALAAGTPDLGPAHNVAGSWNGSPQTQSWRTVALKAGQDYRVTGDAGWCIRVDVHAPAGKLLATFTDGSDDVFGVEFKAVKAGVYHVAATGWRCDPSMPARGFYDLALAHDCLASPRTACALAIGGTWRGQLQDPFDQDWIKVDLVAGRHYTVQISGTDGVASLRDARGADIADATWQPGESQTIVFTAPATGPYFVAVARPGPLFSYSVSVGQG